MRTQFNIQVSIDKEALLPEPKILASRQLRINPENINACVLIKRSLDARNRNIKVNLRYEAFIDEPLPEKEKPFVLNDVRNAQELHIIGAGPAGLFAALEAIHLGFRPILYERGKNVRDRRRDLAKINKEGIVDPESNYCFGEGGAGTYSDGKLYTRSKKRGDVNRILEGLVQFGAKDNITVEAHPHIGTNKLPQIIVAIREAIIESGGAIYFESKLTDLIIKDNRIDEIEIDKTERIKINQLIIATGHSARDIFELLHQKGIKINAKPFAIGVRVEHPQELIDKIQYHGRISDDIVPPASYQLVRQVNDKGVYSFCMCPGGIIAPCATNSGEIVTNGWSPSKRNNPFANSGMVVSIDENDWKDFDEHGPLAAMKFQQSIEQKAYQAVNQNDDKGQLAPAQRLIDFVQSRLSKDLPKCSYQPGIVSARLDQLLPDFISKRLKKAFQLFGKSMKGYLTNEAIVVGVESRTSSPVHIPRDKEKLHHIEMENLYPVGEGAGYAGGIVSAAIDGMKAVSALSKEITRK